MTSFRHEIGRWYTALAMRRVLRLALVLAILTGVVTDPDAATLASSRLSLTAAAPRGETLFCPSGMRSGGEVSSSEHAWRQPDRVCRKTGLTRDEIRPARRLPAVLEPPAFHRKRPPSRSSGGDPGGDVVAFVALRRWVPPSRNATNASPLTEEIAMAWYENEKCVVCGKTIGRVHFWQTKPHLVDAEGNQVKVEKKSDDEVRTLLSSHKVVCDECFSDRYDRLLEILGTYNDHPTTRA